jgi:hypothetical protein
MKERNNPTSPHLSNPLQFIVILNRYFMKITRRQIKELGKLLMHSLNKFEVTYWTYYFKYNKSHKYHYYSFVDLLKNKIDLIKETRGDRNKYYILYSTEYEKLIFHLNVELDFKRENYPIVFKPLDLSHIDLSNCKEIEDYKEVTFEEMMALKGFKEIKKI